MKRLYANKNGILMYLFMNIIGLISTDTVVIHYWNVNKVFDSWMLCDFRQCNVKVRNNQKLKSNMASFVPVSKKFYHNYQIKVCLKSVWKVLC